MKILAADLWPVTLATQSFGQASQMALENGQMRLRQLIENVLLYDEVIIPTDDLVAIGVLAQSFGHEVIATLIDEGVLKFRRFMGQLGYVGAGHGLTVIDARVPNQSGPLGPMWLPTGVAATAILSQLHGVEPRRAKQIAAKIVSATKEIELAEIRPDLKRRTYAAAESPQMDARLQIANRDLNNLGIRPDQVRLLGDLTIDPDGDIGKLMIVARTELELLAKEQSGCDDLSTLSPVGKILATQSPRKSSLDGLYEITDVPDIGTSVLRGAISLGQILTLRDSRHWREFAQWFHEECAKDPGRVAREYVKLLKAPAPLETPFFKIVRLLVSTVAGLISPPVGVAVSALDSFALPKLKEPSAKYFIESLEQLDRNQIGLRS